MRISLVIIGLLSTILFANNVSAQYNKSKSVGKEAKETSESDEDETFKKGFDKKKIIFGGGLGLNFGSRTYIAANPILGYRFSKILGAGISASYNYYSISGIDAATLKPTKETSRSYGGGAWAKAFVFEKLFKQENLISNIFLSAAFEENKIRYTQTIPNSTQDYTSRWYPSLLLGLGLRQRITNSAALNLFIMHDFLEQSPIYINQPIILNVGFSSGL